jgi:hypothetical protein
LYESALPVWLGQVAYHLKRAPVAQLLEQRPFKAMVAGWSPAGGTTALPPSPRHDRSPVRRASNPRSRHTWTASTAPARKSCSAALRRPGETPGRDSPGEVPGASRCSGPDALAVGTHDRALAKFSFESADRGSGADHVGYVCAFVLEVVELKDAGIRLAAIRTSMSSQVLGDERTVGFSPTPSG